MRHRIAVVWVLIAGVLAAAAASAGPDEQKARAEELATRRLVEKRVSIDCTDCALVDAMALLAVRSRVNIAVDGHARVEGKSARYAKVTLKLKNVMLLEAIRQACEQTGLRFAVVKRVVYISDEEGVRRASTPWASVFLTDEITQPDRKVKRQLEETIVSFQFNEQPVMEAIDFLQTLGNLNIIPDRRSFPKDKATITLKLMNVPLETAVTMLCEPLRLRFAVRDGVVWISDDEGMRKAAERGHVYLLEKPTEADLKAYRHLEQTIVSFTFNEQPVMGAIDFLQTLGNLNIVPDRRSFPKDKAAITLKLMNARLETGVKLLSEQIGLRFVIREGVAWLSNEEGLRKAAERGHVYLLEKPTDADLKAYRQLEETVVSFTFNEQPVMEALDFLQTLGRTGIRPELTAFVDPKRTITLKLNYVPLRTACILLAEQFELRCVIRKGVLYLFSEKSFKELQATAKLQPR